MSIIDQFFDANKSFQMQLISISSMKSKKENNHGYAYHIFG